MYNQKIFILLNISYDMGHVLKNALFSLGYTTPKSYGNLKKTNRERKKIIKVYLIMLIKTNTKT